MNNGSESASAMETVAEGETLVMKLLERVFCTLVRYDLSFDKLLDLARNFSWGCFFWGPDQRACELQAGPAKTVQFKLYPHQGRTIREIMKQMEIGKYRPATFREMCAFAKAFGILSYAVGVVALCTPNESEEFEQWVMLEGNTFESYYDALTLDHKWHHEKVVLLAVQV